MQNNFYVTLGNHKIHVTAFIVILAFYCGGLELNPVSPREACLGMW